MNKIKTSFLNEKNINFYKNEGFLYIENFFDNKLIKKLNKSIILSLDEILKKKKLYSTFKNYKLNKKLFEFRKKYPLYFSEFFETLQTIANIYPPLVEKKVLSIVEQLLNISIDFITLTDVGVRLDSPNDTRNALEWHQDSSYYRQNNSGKNGVVAWSPLVQDISLEMGPVEFLRKSQKIGTLMTSKEKSKNRLFSRKISINQNKIQKYLKNATCIKIKQGDVLLMSLDMIHRSGKNLSDKFRITLLARYHNSKSDDFNPGINLYNYNDKKINKKVHGF
jgi:ectoine hydroxylase-related dioxygenase (phytanoyl-CoA dioxygenase family)